LVYKQKGDPDHEESPFPCASEADWPALSSLATTLTMFLTSMGLGREKEIGTLEQLMVTPIRSAEFMIGKVLSFVFIGFVEINFMLAAAFLIFKLKLAGREKGITDVNEIDDAIKKTCGWHPNCFLT